MMKSRFILLLCSLLLFASMVYAFDTNNSESKSLRGLYFMKQIEQTEKTKGDPLFLFSNVHISSIHFGDLFLYKGKIIIKGEIEGNVYAYGADIYIGEEAIIKGNVKTISSRVSCHHNSKVTGSIGPVLNTLNIFKKQWDEALFFYYTDNIPTYIMDLIKAVIQMVISLLFLSLFKKTVIIQGKIIVNQTKDVLHRGLVIYLMLFALVLVFTLSLVAFPIAIILIITGQLFTQFGKTVLALVIGEFLINKINDKSDIYIKFWIGILLIQLIKLVPLLDWCGNLLILPFLSLGMFSQMLINKLTNSLCTADNTEYENELNHYYQAKLYEVITKNIRGKKEE